MFDVKFDRPAFQIPKHACDTHFHIFGNPDQYPYVGAKDLRYAPQIAEAKDYLLFGKAAGFERMVLVQPSCFGKDNSCQLDAAMLYGLENSRVIVDLEDDCPDAKLDELSKRGACGIRINVRPIEPLTAGLAERLLPRINLWERRCQEIGWMMDFLFPDWLTTEMIPYLEKIRVPYTIAHMGMNKACNGVSSEGFQRLLGLVANGEGYCWIKLTAPYRISTDPEYKDIVPMAQAMLKAAPDRILWGSDYPHASFEQHNTMRIFNLIEKYAADEAVRERLLVRNPAELYGFSLD